MKYLVSWVTDEGNGNTIHEEISDFQSKQRVCSKIINNFLTAEELCHQLDVHREDYKILDYDIYVNLDEYFRMAGECEKLKEKMREISKLANNSLK